MKFVPIMAGLGAAFMLSVTACGTNVGAPPTPPAPSPTKNAATTTVAPKTVNLTLSIITGRMAKKPGWPKYTPANATLPRNAIVNVTIHNYDDGNASIPNGYNQVRGTIGGTMNVDGHTVKSVPVASVAHTLTIAAIGLNVPMPVRTSSERYDTITFSFRTPATPQRLRWQCMAACGTGTSGWQGPMVTNGWMTGYFKIQ